MWRVISAGICAYSESVVDTEPINGSWPARARGVGVLLLGVAVVSAADLLILSAITGAGAVAVTIVTVVSFGCLYWGIEQREKRIERRGAADATRAA